VIGMKHYLAEYEFNDSVLSFTAKNKKEAIKNLDETCGTIKGKYWYLSEVD
jgi:hypothetical protein